jgi:hypothetical protein
MDPGLLNFLAIIYLLYFIRDLKSEIRELKLKIDNLQMFNFMSSKDVFLNSDKKAD